jgi:hypothetical protein
MAFSARAFMDSVMVRGTAYLMAFLSKILRQSHTKKGRGAEKGTLD